jgi:hypothetical protein
MLDYGFTDGIQSLSRWIFLAPLAVEFQPGTRAHEKEHPDLPFSTPLNMDMRRLMI